MYIRTYSLINQLRVCQLQADTYIHFYHTYLQVIYADSHRTVTVRKR